MRRVLRALSFRKVSALYLLAVIFLTFSIWIPGRFLTWNNWKTIFENQATVGIAAVGLVIPLAAGSFDLAVGTEVGLGVVLLPWLLVNTGIPTVIAVLITLAAGAVVGLASGGLIVRMRIDSFIATLAMSSVLTAIVEWLSGDQQIIVTRTGFEAMARDQWLGITLPVYILLAVAVVVWYALEMTPAGRRIYATGGNLDAARLAGVSTATVVVVSLAACALIAGGAGVVESAALGGGDPTIGPDYLLPAVTAAVLGSTQFREGRFNVWGTIVAVYVLEAGVQGLELAGAPTWIPSLFDGVALAASVALARFEASTAATSGIRRVLKFDRDRGGAALADRPDDVTV